MKFRFLGERVRRSLHHSDSTATPPNGKRVVIAGCARDAAQNLRFALQQAAAIGSIFSAAAYVFVENDSDDDTPGILSRWVRFRRHAHLLKLGRLAAKHPKRTERLAIARNAYLDFIRQSPYADYDYLVVMDLDDLWARPLDPAALRSAVEHLCNTSDLAAVFANSFPLYYDVWALRHPTWSPDDCWRVVNDAEKADWPRAIDQHVRSRQIYLPADAEPIAVESAFGGVGIYELLAALQSKYVGLDYDDAEICEHVPFNRGVGAHGRLEILPALQVCAPSSHLDPVAAAHLKDAREMFVRTTFGKRLILAPHEHPLDRYQLAHPLYDRRLPEFAAILSMMAPDTAIIDIGANIGDTAAIMREAGCSLPIVCIEPSSRYFAYLHANCSGSLAAVSNVTTRQCFVGNPDRNLTLIEHNGTAFVASAAVEGEADQQGAIPWRSLDGIFDGVISLVKCDTDGFDAQILLDNSDFINRDQPVIWAEMDTAAGATAGDWAKVFDRLLETHSFVIIFDNFGFLIAHGNLRDLAPTLLILFSYCARHKAAKIDRAGAPPIYYMDIVFVPDRWRPVANQFLDALPETERTSLVAN